MGRLMKFIHSTESFEHVQSSCKYINRLEFQFKVSLFKTVVVRFRAFVHVRNPCGSLPVLDQSVFLDVRSYVPWARVTKGQLPTGKRIHRNGSQPLVCHFKTVSCVIQTVGLSLTVLFTERFL